MNEKAAAEDPRILTAQLRQHIDALSEVASQPEFLDLLQEIRPPRAKRDSPWLRDWPT
jgi:hypothetical protein